MVRKHRIEASLQLPKIRYRVKNSSLNSLCLSLTGMSGFVQLDANADRIMDYKVWHLSFDGGTKYVEFLDLEMSQLQQQSQVGEIWFVLIGYKTTSAGSSIM